MEPINVPMAMAAIWPLAPRFAVEVIREIRVQGWSGVSGLPSLFAVETTGLQRKIGEEPCRVGAVSYALAAAGVDLFHCSQRRFWEPEFEGSSLNLAGWTKKLIGKPTLR